MQSTPSGVRHPLSDSAATPKLCRLLEGANAMETCIFCQIVAGDAHGHIVYKDQYCTAFLDIDGFNPGHTLVVPNHHVAQLADLSPEAGAHVIATALRIASAILMSNLSSEGFNLFMSDGECAGQEVTHIHPHVLPRFSGDGINIGLGRDSLAASPEALAMAAQEVARHVGEAASS
jgi:histidine triad (HIT) family protein